MSDPTSSGDVLRMATNATFPKRRSSIAWCIGPGPGFARSPKREADRRSFVACEFGKYLRCGIPEHGFCAAVLRALGPHDVGRLLVQKQNLLSFVQRRRVNVGR